MNRKNSIFFLGMPLICISVSMAWTEQAVSTETQRQHLQLYDYNMRHSSVQQQRIRINSPLSEVIVTAEAEAVQPLRNGYIMLIITLTNTGTEKVTISNPLDGSLHFMLMERYPKRLIFLPNIPTRLHVDASREERNKIRLPFQLREMRYNGRIMRQEEIEQYEYEMPGQAQLDIVCEIDRIQISDIKPQQIISLPAGDYWVGMNIELQSVHHQKIERELAIDVFDSESPQLSVSLVEEPASSKEQQAIIAMLSNTQASEDICIKGIKRLVYQDHPSETLLPLFLELLAAKDRPTSVKQAALRGVAKIQESNGLNIYRNYATDKTLPLQLRSDAILFLGDFGVKEDRSLLIKIEEENNEGLAHSLANAAKELSRRYPSQ